MEPEDPNETGDVMGPDMELHLNPIPVTIIVKDGKVQAAFLDGEPCRAYVHDYNPTFPRPCGDLAEDDQGNLYTIMII